MDRDEYVKGAWDIHVHASPSLFPRWGDAVDLAKLCLEHSMAGFVIKFHHGSSVEAAYTANVINKDIKIYGGITLNYPIGGLNPHAVDAALALGAKFVWLPTIHAENHKKAFGVLGGFYFQKSSLGLEVNKGLKILDEKGELAKSLKIILDILDGKHVVLATGHISPDEIFSLKSYIKSEDLKIPLLINHTLFKAPNLNEKQISELSDDQTWFETVYLTVADISENVSIKKVAEIINKTSDSHWIIASDSGQKDNIKSPFAISKYAGMLNKEGVNKKRVLKMLKDEPQQLFNF